MITKHYKEMPEPLYEENDITIIFMWHPPLFNSILPHWHTRTEFLLLTEGKLHVTCGSFSGELEQGDILVVNPHQLHAAKAGKEGVKYYAIILEPRMSNGLKVKVNNQYTSLFPSKYSFKNHIRDQRLAELMMNIVEEEKKKENSYELFIQGFVIEAYALLHRYYIDSIVPGSYADSEIFKILSHIDENYADRITTDTVSRDLGYNKSHFCRKFRSYTGTSFVNYLTMLRLEKAISILQSTGKSISEIASEVGFGSANYFTRQFVKHYGKAPIDIRKSLKNL